ncbi:hypothetical protein D030_2792A, partial [Vibrio parahaemolyticus AQ3810]
MQEQAITPAETHQS